MRFPSILAIAAASCLNIAHAAETYDMRSISYDSAEKVLRGALKEADKQDRNVAIVIVDATGEIILSARMDGAKPAAMDLAFQKAKTALLFRGSSRTAEEAINDGAVALLTLDSIAALPGGLAYSKDGAFLGAIGVSGAPANIDEQIAGAGLKKIKD